MSASNFYGAQNSLKIKCKANFGEILVIGEGISAEELRFILININLR